MGPISHWDLQKTADRVSARNTDTTRHKCFVSYHAADSVEVQQFIEQFGETFIPRVIGVSDDDPWVDSSNTDYIMSLVRERYLGDSTVTIVLVGRCTWARRYVDWEVYSSLKQYAGSQINGLMAVTLPSAANYSSKQLPARVDDNVIDVDGYARWYKYPSTQLSLRNQIETAFGYRSSRSHLINNSRTRKLNSSPCTP